MKKVVVVSDRGGHWHNAQMLISSLEFRVDGVVTTTGPEVAALRREFDAVVVLPTLFTFLGKRRFFNPAKATANMLLAFYWALRIRPSAVISLGATNVVCFSLFSKILGSQLFHVECMNQVFSPSITGRILYPICDRLYVQWPELLNSYGPKATYQGWVL